MKSSYLPIIGLEVHIELKTKSKMFCGCKNEHFKAEPNTNICPACLGLPGALPVPNKKAIEDTLTIALTFNCQINKNFWFDRKNYFYPDLPKGYQISQHFAPIGVEGMVPILVEGKTKNIALSDIHLEEDTGKLIHKNNKTLINFNRSGVPLVEIVTKPVLHSTEEVKEYLKRIQQTIRYLNLSDCDMEKGSMRLEANISVSETQKLPDYKVEVKNLNSFRFVEKAINYEVKRQTTILKKGEKPKQETRGFNSKTGETYSQRTKELAKDYRYFPEPDIPPFFVTDKDLTKIKKVIGKMPWEIEKEIMKTGVKWQWAKMIGSNPETKEIFFETIKIADSNITPIDVAKWLVNKKIELKIEPADFLKAIKREREKFNLSEDIILKSVKEVINQHSKAVSDYKNGKTQVIGFLIGQIQQKTGGKADPEKSRKLLIKFLDDVNLK